MPHATMKLIPGIDTNKTPALNEAAFSQSQLIRFIYDRNGMGLVQKLGGWADWSTLPDSGNTNPIVIPNINELHPWQDLNAVSRLAVGSNSALSYITEAGRNLYTITPQVAESDSPTALAQTVTITNASPAVFTCSLPAISSATAAGTTGTITFSTAHGLTAGALIVLAGFTPSGWNGSYAVQTVPSSTTITVTLASAIGNASVVGTSSSPLAPGTPIALTTTGTLPTGLLPFSPTGTANVYYVANTPAPTNTTFSVATSIGGAAVNTSSAGSGVHTARVINVLTAINSSTVTICDTGIGFQAKVSFTNASPTVVTGTSAPVANTPVVFRGTSLPTGITQGTTYYAQPLTSTTFNLTNAPTTGSYSYINTTSTGSGAMYSPDQIRAGYNSWIKTPISIANLLISGIYTVTNYISSPYYSIYQIDTGVLANANSYSATVPSFQPDNGFSDVTVTQTNHPYQNGSTATFLVSTTGSGLTIYGNYTVEYINATSYRIYASSAATSGTAFSMNGGEIRFEYYYNIASPYSAGGYGTGGYGVGGYGAGQALTITNAPTITTTDWSLCNFGEILIASPQGGAIYYWSPTDNTSTAYLLETAPTANQGVFVAMPARQLVAFGSTVTGIQDPLLIRWSDAADATVWTASANNLAGSYRIPEGSTIVTALQGPQQILVWTDLAVWAMQFVGGTSVYGFNKLADGVGAISKKSAAVLGNGVYWMSPKNFNVMMGGGPQTIQCPVWDKVFQNLNTGTLPNGQPATSLIRCATNSIFNEVTWYYPSASATHNDSYVKYNTSTQQWDYGTLDRTSWTDQSVLGPPIGANSTGTIYQHEYGYNNGTSPMICSFETGYMQLNDADNLIFVDQIWPDFKWQTADGATTAATLYITFYGTNYPGDTPTAYGPYTMTQGTEYISTRIRNRLLAISVSTSPDGTNADLNSFFRIGAIRYRYQIDGKF